MALGATIYKFSISLSDLNRNYFDQLQLTVAQHPSESLERMMARLLAYCLHVDSGLEFTKGLSTPETPDIWLQSLDGNIEQWIWVGEPSPENCKKASRQAQNVWIYSFNSKSNTWWELSKAKFEKLDINVLQFEEKCVGQLANCASRTMTLTLTVSDDLLQIVTQDKVIDLHYRVLQGA